MSEWTERQVWFVRLLDAGWKFKWIFGGVVYICRPGKEEHRVDAEGCCCWAWRTRGSCPHAKVYAALGRTPGIARLVEWFNSREVMK